jgi:nucleoid-associated protein YgaU
MIVLLSGCSQSVRVEKVDKPIDWMKPGTNEKVVFKEPTRPVDVVLYDFKGKVKPVELESPTRKAKGKPVEFKPADIHKVVKGECLWWIAEYKGVYDDPFKWPLIYKANKHQIKNPDLIYPGQELIIPR